MWLYQVSLFLPFDIGTPKVLNISINLSFSIHWDRCQMCDAYVLFRFCYSFWSCIKSKGCAPVHEVCYITLCTQGTLLFLLADNSHLTITKTFKLYNYFYSLLFYCPLFLFSTSTYFVLSPSYMRVSQKFSRCDIQ